MFTGIVEVQSKVVSHDVRDEVMSITFAIPEGWKLHQGQSIAVNGVCLTVVLFDEETFTVELMSETLMKTTFGTKIPQSVNLERSMRATDRFEGHIVQGHVDMVGEVVAISKGGATVTLTISYDKKFSYSIVEKGSVAIDGVSLTAVDIKDGIFSVALIPHTVRETTLGDCTEGDMVNLEFDIIGKYLVKHS